MKKAAIIVAGGFGTRIGGDVPKQFQHIGGKPIVLWALEALYNFDPEITLMLVIPAPHAIASAAPAVRTQRTRF